MKIPGLLLLAPAVIWATAFTTDERQLRVREVAGHADLREGEILSEAREIRNGGGARVQLDCGESVFRLGANSSVVVDRSQFRFNGGDCLFANLSPSLPLLIDAGGKKIQVTQGTGVAHKLEEKGQARVVIGCIAGKTKVTFAGKTQRLNAGELLIVEDKGPFGPISFDLPKQINTCALLQDFKTQLPTHAEVETELARYSSLEKRGFIRKRGDQPHEATLDATTRRAQREFGSVQSHNAAVAVSPNPPSSGGSGSVIITGPTFGGRGGRDDDDGGTPIRPGGGGQPGNGPPGPGTGGNGPRGPVKSGK
jgi:hypothetical protein